MDPNTDIALLRDIPISNIHENLVSEWNALLDNLADGKKGNQISDNLFDVCIRWCSSENGSIVIINNRIQQIHGTGFDILVSMSALGILMSNSVVLTNEQTQILLLKFIALDTLNISHADEKKKLPRNSSTGDNIVDSSALAREMLLRPLFLSAFAFSASQMASLFGHFTGTEKSIFLTNLVEYAEKEGVLESNVVSFIKTESSKIRQDLGTQPAVRVSTLALDKRLDEATKKMKTPKPAANHHTRNPGLLKSGR